MEIGEDKNAVPMLTEKLPNSKKLTFDDLLLELGEFGPYQRRQFMLACLPKIFAGMHMLISIFVAAVPPHRCSIPGWENDTYEIQDPLHQMYVNLTIPSLPGHDPVYSKCELYTAPGESNSSTVKCSHWVYDNTTFHSSVVSDFNLVCDKVSYRSHKRMTLMFGLLIGSLIMGFLSDVVGRKISFCISTNVQTISGIANVFAPDFYSFCAFRFVNGMANAGIFIIGYVIITETFGPNKRRWVGVVSGFFFSIGLVLLAGMSYLLRDWKHLQLACSVPGLLFVLYWWFLEETPRWLIRKGRREQAGIVLKRLAKANRTKFTEQMLDSVSLDTPKNKENFFLIFTYPVLLMRTCIMFLNWVVVNLAYYGLSLNSGNLAGNMHLNVFLNGLSDLPAQAVLLLAVTRVGRRPLFSGSMILGGVSCICTLLTVLYADTSLRWMTVALSTLGKAFISVAFSAVYIVTTEIFPTSIRNSALGACALFARIGAMISPYIADLGIHVEGKLGQAVPLVTFGVSAVIAGALVLLLPETFRRKLPETIQDSVDLGRKKQSDVLELRWDGQSSWGADVESPEDPLCGHKRDSA